MKNTSKLLLKLIESGRIYVSNESYIGIAADGVHVILGNTDNIERLEKYLTDYPTPNKW